jgi:hypothetical protein
MRKTVFLFLFAVFAFVLWPKTALAKTASPSAVPVVSAEPVPSAAPDITQKSKETLGPLEEILQKQKLGPILPFNFLKYAIRNSVAAGVPANTIVLLLLLPVVATVIAAARHLIGLRGFGIFLPAALSVVFVATGPLVGVGLFLVIVMVSILVRFVFRLLKFKLQYLPRMALILWFVVLGVLGVLFLAPFIKQPYFANVSIFAVLILALLAEDFTRVQLGKSFKTALTLTSETMLLALISFLFLTLKPIQEFALKNPETLLLSVAAVDYLLGRYVGLRLLEIWRFRKLLKA